MPATAANSFVATASGAEAAATGRCVVAFFLSFFQLSRHFLLCVCLLIYYPVFYSSHVISSLRSRVVALPVVRCFALLALLCSALLASSDGMSSNEIYLGSIICFVCKSRKEKQGDISDQQRMNQ